MKAKILVVDDNHRVLEIATEQLTGLGYRVTAASSGVEALEMLRHDGQVDLLFTDVVMPGEMAGRALAAKAMEMRPRLKVLFASGYFEGALVGGGQLDADVHFLPKPYRKGGAGPEDCGSIERRFLVANETCPPRSVERSVGRVPAIPMHSHERRCARAPYLAPGRDLRLDFFRGLALWFIYIDHVPDNIVSWFTVRNYGFSDATEIFVFISGYTAVIAYSRMMLRDGWPRAAVRIYRRVWQLYVAHILLFVAFTAQIAYVSIARDTPQLIEEMQLMGLGENPYRAIVETVLLKFRPVNLDVLPLYIVLLAAFPLRPAGAAALRLTLRSWSRSRSMP